MLQPGRGQGLQQGCYCCYSLVGGRGYSRAATVTTDNSSGVGATAGLLLLLQPGATTATAATAFCYSLVLLLPSLLLPSGAAWCYYCSRCYCLLLLPPLLVPSATAWYRTCFHCCYSLVPHLLPLLLQPGTAPAPAAAAAATAWYRTCSRCCCRCRPGGSAQVMAGCASPRARSW